jgi:dipeptidyl aminopeptidase/acylaminoacyl peptidase
VDRVPGRLVLQDATADGRLLVDRQSIRHALWAGTAGRGERDLTWSDFSFVTDLSADGRKVVFAEATAAEGPEYGAYVRSVEGGPAVRLGNGLPLALSPDGAWALVGRPGPPLTVSLVPTGPGTPRPVPLGDVSVVESARFFPDGRQLLLRAQAEGRPARLWVTSVDGGIPRPITPEGVAPLVEASPDGARLAGIDDDGALRLWSRDGAELGTVPGRFEDRTVLRWAADGRGVLVRDKSLPVNVSHVALDSGQVRQQLRVPESLGRAGLVAVLTLFLSADGRTYAYTDSERLSRLYVVEGLTTATPQAAAR